MHQAVHVPGINNSNLKIFVKDLPFNFALEQALDSLEDPRALAEVAWLQMLVTQVPVYNVMSQAIQTLSTAFHKFQEQFNHHTGRTVIQLEAMKHQMEAAHICSYTQVVLKELAYACELWGHFYCPPIPGLLENPRRYYFRLLPTAQMVTAQGVEWGRTDDNCRPLPRKHSSCVEKYGWAFWEYRLEQWATNKCHLCRHQGHWIQECMAPHLSCRGLFCDLWHSHPGFNKHACHFP
jgi:hypothetical protein